MVRRDGGGRVNGIDRGVSLSWGHPRDDTNEEPIATRVRDVMRAAPPGVVSTEPVVAAARRLRAHAVAAVPICAADGEFLGMLTSADIIDRCVADGQDPRSMSTGELLVGPVVGVSPDEVFGSRVLGLVLAQPFPMLPVVTDDGRLIGMLTVDDVAGYLLEGDHVDDAMFEPGAD